MRGNFVLLRAGTLRIVVPQAQVGGASYLDERPDPLQFAALSDDMTLLPECPAERFIAAPFSGDNDGVMWCWDELRVLIDTELHPIAVPESIRTSGTPVDGYVEIDGEPAFVCDAARLCAYAFAHRS